MVKKYVLILTLGLVGAICYRSFGNVNQAAINKDLISSLSSLDYDAVSACLAAGAKLPVNSANVVIRANDGITCNLAIDSTKLDVTLVKGMQATIGGYPKDQKDFSVCLLFAEKTAENIEKLEGLQPLLAQHGIISLPSSVFPASPDAPKSADVLVNVYKMLLINSFNSPDEVLMILFYACA